MASKLSAQVSSAIGNVTQIAAKTGAFKNMLDFFVFFFLLLLPSLPPSLSLSLSLSE
jgi:hypothetical protein